MKFYLAPMEGITTYIYRNAYHRWFGGADKFFTPFIASRRLNRRELNEILPEHNRGISVVPQILTNRADEFLEIAGRIAEYGYQTVNLNLGCPSGTVTAKKRGAGFLSVPDELDRFLYEIFEKAAVSISIKTRIGVEAMEEWAHIMEIYRKYPVKELIVHPRFLKDFYQSTPHTEAFFAAVHTFTDTPLCYNGDITSKQSFDTLMEQIPQTDCVMAGRGILKNPALILQLKNTDITEVYTSGNLKNFHDEIFENYAAIMDGPKPTLFKMKDLWTYLSASFERPEKPLKKIRKSSNYMEYQTAVNRLFEECALVTLH